MKGIMDIQSTGKVMPQHLPLLFHGSVNKRKWTNITGQNQQDDMRKHRMIEKYRMIGNSNNKNIEGYKNIE